MLNNESLTELSPSQKIDAQINELGEDWRGQKLKEIRQLIKQTDPEIVEEWKWRGTAVWSHNGIICTGEVYKNVVKMTFAKGALLPDPDHLFNSGLEGNIRRAIDFHQDDEINKIALSQLIRDAITVNDSSRKSVHKSESI
ncbi:MAG TPA: DUF1801 domain-containing protein [Flexilinea sp.]|jgi:hypothetical protein|nr:DUF1801 domain-containing protein [Flexilinea sp.]